ncbi:putative glutamate ABC transporter permease protein [Actinoplanes missouriensis 431]|uniref:Putative glutamate ABC transporter permease protein n=1 Tax=Actinoplanes missouriensis (strain ATCC 14538 / DSM 43046 / CBS 188.64 / JCM 3121 / NBRC 102363 / NCIMB 12654 / NRRL B-3342 / UNCC 431) TaxID=512565 RepID=I0HGJ1_ACTM4|nr:amino acid ABC transporter permease [Actinoplanes missouriensis]BAL92128.1 putative glutamate ABC transporter permease protein [Actinoplanes missouriensis 431]
MSVEAVLYDHPGPRAKRRNAILTVVFGLALLGLLYWIYAKFDEKGQWDAALWKPFTEASTWTDYIVPGLLHTLGAAAVAMLLSLTFGIVFSVGRLSEHWWVRIPAGAVVEFFRAVPLLLLMFFIFYGLPFIIEQPMSIFWAVVIGLTLYNGSVLAEAFRAGILAVPRGQSEAAYAVGMRKSQVMREILVPQAARSMLPVIVSQMVVLVKDTALGYIISYPELLQFGVNNVAANFGNVVQAAIVVMIIFILVNSALTALAGWLERRTRRSGRAPRATGQPVPAGLTQTGEAAGD